MSYSVVNQIKDETSQVVAASKTNAIVSNVFDISEADSKNLLIKVVASSVTSTTGITAKLQDSFDGGTTWEDAETVTIDDDGNFEIEHDASESSTGSLWNKVRVVITTGASDAVTVSAVYVTRRS